MKGKKKVTKTGTQDTQMFKELLASSQFTRQLLNSHVSSQPHFPTFIPHFGDAKSFSPLNLQTTHASLPVS